MLYNSDIALLPLDNVVILLYTYSEITIKKEARMVNYEVCMANNGLPSLKMFYTGLLTDSYIEAKEAKDA